SGRRDRAFLALKALAMASSLVQETDAPLASSGRARYTPACHERERYAETRHGSVRESGAADSIAIQDGGARYLRGPRQRAATRGLASIRRGVGYPRVGKASSTAILWRQPDEAHRVRPVRVLRQSTTQTRPRQGGGS